MYKEYVQEEEDPTQNSGEEKMQQGLFLPVSDFISKISLIIKQFLALVYTKQTKSFSVLPVYVSIK